MWWHKNLIGAALSPETLTRDQRILIPDIRVISRKVEPMIRIKTETESSVPFRNALARKIISMRASISEKRNTYPALAQGRIGRIFSKNRNIDYA
ncbi:MAG: hypothetical protein ABS69_20655 [Nitrosomonadales bacterium SCN 54-20]|nr:MAG: hypothetical protein ABS69_20655 [Nitrosomonadales bacterium SCN 54-20]